MSEHPSGQEQLIQQIAEPTGGTHGREAARAKLDVLLVRDLTASLGQLDGELVQTREQMAKSSDAASRHQRALIRWTVVLSLATIAYAAAAFLPVFWRSFPASGSSERAWLLWIESPADSNNWQLSYGFGPAFEKKAECERALLEASNTMIQQRADQQQRLGRMPPVDYRVCLPDTVDPREPKGK